MRISRDELSKFGRPVAPPPAPIEPKLAPAEEAALIARGNPSDPTIKARRERAITLLRRAATPEGADAEILALLAAMRALPLDRREDRLSARQRLVGIGNLTDPPPEVLKLLRKLRIEPGDGQSFADALLPPKRDGSTPFHSGGSGATESGGSA